MNFQFEHLLIDGNLVAVSLILGLWMALGHVVLDPHSDRLPRWLAYVSGVGSIVAAFATLTITRHLPEPIAVHQYQPVIDIVMLVLAAAVGPTIGRVWMLYQEHRWTQQSAKDQEQVRQIRKRTTEQ